jgi:hypothetical protein
MSVHKLFCYGSNSCAQLQKRLKLKEPLASNPAFIQGYRLIFAGYSLRWKGGVATIWKPNKTQAQQPLQARVYGIVVELTTAQLEMLDAFEKGYTRKCILVNVEGRDKKTKCQVYVKDDTEYTHAPSEKYIAAIKQLLINDAKRRSPQIPISGIVDGKFKTF